MPDWNRQTGEGLPALDDPEEWDAAYERGAQHLGTAAIGLALTCSLEQASPRVVRAMRGRSARATAARTGR